MRMHSGEPYYDEGYICIQGHWINRRGRDYPQHNSEFCPQCGTSVINRCPACGESIRGDYVIPGVPIARTIPVPAYCLKCGKPYPWTVERITAAQELIDLMGTVEGSEREAAKVAIPDMMHDGPRTRVAAIRISRILEKVSGNAATAFRDILVDIASEAAKKVLFPTQ